MHPVPLTPADTIALALADPVISSRAPRPENGSERLVFRHLYETLTRLDCQGDLRPQLAESWHSEEEGRRWTFVLRDGADFSDGTEVTPAAVRASWLAAGVVGWLGVPPDSIIAGSERSLTVAFDHPDPDAPALLAHAHLSVATSSPESEWPLGSAAYRVAVPTRAPEDSDKAVTLVAVPGRAMGSPRSIRFISDTAGDARDVVDQGVDLLITDDRAVLDYVGGEATWATVPLPWETVYVLVSSTSVPVTGDQTAAARVDLQVSLARDAVRSDARGASHQLWWDAQSACELSLPDAASVEPRSPPDHRIVYAAHDRTARELAERLVALAGSASGARSLSFIWPDLSSQVRAGDTRATAVGLMPSEFAKAFDAGRDLGYVVALPLNEAAPCRRLRSLVADAPWLIAFPPAPRTLEPGPPRIPAAQLGVLDRIVPLIETRRHAVVRRGTMGLAVDWDGTVRVERR